MENELKYNIIRRDVKNVRLRVSEDGTVDIYVPEHFSDSDISVAQVQTPQIKQQNSPAHQLQAVTPARI